MASEGLQPKPELDERRVSDLLEGWKAIADHLDKTERTVQRWEKNKGLPVRRLRADPREDQPRVYAYKSEIDAWWNRNTELEDESKTDSGTLGPVVLENQQSGEESRTAPSSKPFKRLILPAVAFLLGAVVVAALVWPQIRNRFWPPETRLALEPLRML